MHLLSRWCSAYCAQYLRIEDERTSAKEIEKPSVGQPMGFVARDSEPEAGHAVMISSAPANVYFHGVSPKGVSGERKKNQGICRPATQRTGPLGGGAAEGHAGGSGAGEKKCCYRGTGRGR